MVTALVGAMLALVAGPATAVPTSGTQTLSCTGDQTGAFSATVTLSADLQPARRIAVGRTISLAGLTADLEVPTAVADRYRGGVVSGAVQVLTVFSQSATGTVMSGTRSASISGPVPTSGPVTARARLGTFSFTPKATGDVNVGAGADIIFGTIINASSDEDFRCQADSANLLGINDTVQVVQPLQQSVAFVTQAPSGAVIGDSYHPAATASSGGPVTYASNTPAVCTVAGGTVTAVATGQCTVLASQAGDELTDPASATQTFTVAKKPQAISFAGVPVNPAQAGTSYQPRATASSGLPVTLTTADANVCTVSGGTVSYVGGGECVVRADQAGDSTYAAAARQIQVITVNRVHQVLSFTSTPPDPARVGATYALAATATSGLAVTYGSSTPAVCTVDGAVATLVTAGTCTVTADQTGNAIYDPASQQTQTFAVTRAPQSPRFVSTPPSPAQVGSTYDVRLDGGPSGNALTLASTTPTVCTVLGTTVSLVAAGTCTLSLTQAGSAAYEPGGPVTQSFTVTRVPTAITVTAPAGAVSGQSLQLTATPSGAPAGTVQFTLDGTAVGAPVAWTGTPVTSPVFSTTAGTHTLGATLTPADPVRYSGATASSSYVVARAATTTTVAIAPGSVTATVSPVAPGSGTPTGSVRFLLDGSPIGSGPLTATADGARATLVTTVPSGSERSLTAVYDGDTEFVGSTTTTRRSDPTITAVVLAQRRPSASGWYADRLVVRWTCTTSGAPLATACPADAAVVDDGTTTLTRTISTTDGGSATATTVVRLDQDDPRARVRGVRSGRPRCRATDTTSGVRSCRLFTVRHGAGTVVYRAVAYDQAGNKDVARRVVRRR